MFFSTKPSFLFNVAGIFTLIWAKMFLNHWLLALCDNFWAGWVVAESGGNAGHLCECLLNRFFFLLAFIQFYVNFRFLALKTSNVLLSNFKFQYAVFAITSMVNREHDVLMKFFVHWKHSSLSKRPFATWKITEKRFLASMNVIMLLQVLCECEALKAKTAHMLLDNLVSCSMSSEREAGRVRFFATFFGANVRSFHSLILFFVKMFYKMNFHRLLLI